MVENIYFKMFYIIAGYLLGSVVFGYIVAIIIKKKGFGLVDRPGTAGAARQYGLKAAIPTFLFDCGKGVLVPLIGKIIGLDIITIVIASLAVLVGHNWPVFFRFRGGGGVATAMGVAGYLVTIPFFITLATSFIIGLIYKYTLGKKHKVNKIVAGSIFGICLLPILTYFFHKSLLLFLLTIGIFIIIAIKGLLLHFLYRNVPTAN
jgi:glycerol-3-phosphate acyltransferase PlsY